MRYENPGDLPRPLRITLSKGTYFWCRCGKTRNAPYCDGRHARTGTTPLKFMADGVTEIRLCTCGLTDTPPQCDGSHARF